MAQARDSSGKFVASGKVIIDTSSVRASIKSANAAIGQLRGGLQNTAKIMTGALAAGTAALAGGLLAVGVSGVKMAISLEQQMADIQAVMGLTTDEVAALEDEIVSLGLDPNLKVSTEEAAAAIEMLGRNGLTTTEILGGAAKSTVLLANATGAEFGTAANIATDVMALFNIEADDMITAVDGITSVASNSKFSIDDYALALAQGGGVAATAGVEFDDFNTAIAAMSPLFASGSDAGTSFKTMLQRMAAPTDKAMGVMMDLGLATEDGANKFFDAEGNMRSMAEISGLLATATADLSDEQRTQALSTIFGADAIRAAAGLAAVGEEEFRNLQETMGDTSATDAAAVRMDTLAGSIEIMGGVVDAIKLKFGQLFGGAIRDGVERFTGFLDTASTAVFQFIERVKGGMSPAMALAFALNKMGVAPETVARIREFAEKFLELKDAALVFINDVVIPFVTEHKDEFIGALTAIGAVIMGAGVIGAILALANPLAAVIAVVGLLGAAWAGNWGGIQEKTTAVIEWLRPYVIGAIQAIKDFWAANGDALVLKVTETLNLIWLVYSTYFGFIWDVITTVAEAIAVFWAAHSELLTEVATAAWQTIHDWIINVWDLLNAALQVFISLFSGDWEALGDDLSDLWAAAWKLITDMLSGTWATIKPILSSLWVSIRDWFNGIDWKSLGLSIMNGVAAGVSSGLDSVKSAITSALAEAWAAAKAAIGMNSPAKLYVTMGVSQMQGIVKGTKQMAGKLQSAMSGVVLDGAAAASAVISSPSTSGVLRSQTAVNQQQQPQSTGSNDTNLNIYGPITIDGSGGGAGVLAQLKQLAEAG